jgi:hypothetical protein
MAERHMKNSNKKLIGGAGAVAGAAAIAGALYYLYGTESGKKQRVKIVAWMKDAEKDILEEVSRLKDTAFTEENYRRIVKEVTKRYEALKNLDPDAIAAFMVHANSAWKIAKEKALAKRAVPAKKKRAAKKSRTRSTSSSTNS